MTRSANNKSALRPGEWLFWRFITCAVPMAVALALHRGQWANLAQPPLRDGLALLATSWQIGSLLARRAVAVGGLRHRSRAPTRCDASCRCSALV